MSEWRSWESRGSGLEDCGMSGVQVGALVILGRCWMEFRGYLDIAIVWDIFGYCGLYLYRRV